MDWVLIITQLLNGLQLGLLLFLLASGLTLVFGIMDFVNLAHGALYMIGAYFCASLSELLGSFLLAIAIAIPATAAAGALLEVLIIRRLYSKDHLDHVLATFGLILCFDTMVHFFWGPEGKAIELPAFLDGRLTILPGVEFPTFRLSIILAGLLLAFGLYFVISHTKTGMLIRAGASNRQMVSAHGVDIKSLFTIVFAVGAAMAGFAGMMISPITEASIGMGNEIIIVAFVVIIIGGIGSIKGAFVAAILVGLIDTMGRSFLDTLLKIIVSEQNAETAAPALSAMAIYILMATILAFRPQGLFPPKGR